MVHQFIASDLVDVAVYCPDCESEIHIPKELDNDSTVSCPGCPADYEARTLRSWVGPLEEEL